MEEEILFRSSESLGLGDLSEINRWGKVDKTDFGSKSLPKHQRGGE